MYKYIYKKKRYAFKKLLIIFQIIQSSFYHFNTYIVSYIYFIKYISNKPILIKYCQISVIDINDIFAFIKL